MILTKSRILKIIREELDRLLFEQESPSADDLRSRVDDLSSELVSLETDIDSLKKKEEEDSEIAAVKKQAEDLVSGLEDALDERQIGETIKKIGKKFVVYPKKGGKRLGTHSSRTSAEKQLAAIEISKSKSSKKKRK